MILTMEGTMYPTYEDEYGILPLTDADENPISDEDEAYYTDYILSGLHDEGEADREGEYFTDETYDEWDSIRAGDRWERAYWGD